MMFDACRHVVPHSADRSFSPNYKEISILQYCWGRYQWPPAEVGPRGHGQQWGPRWGLGRCPQGTECSMGPSLLLLYAVTN